MARGEIPAPLAEALATRGRQARDDELDQSVLDLGFVWDLVLRI